jgi:hypothetical protein
MPDRITIEGGKAQLETAEGATHSFTEEDIEQYYRSRVCRPDDGVALADGVKYIEFKDKYMVIVHQTPPHARRLRWIASDSPAPFGPGTEYRNVRVSLPYMITAATFYSRGGKFSLTGNNELYFRNEPLRHKSDRLGYPALLNVSRIKGKKREKTWICVQYLSVNHRSHWTSQLDALLGHTLNGGFNLSSEHHEGASYYGVSVAQNIHPDLSPIERWQERTDEDETWVLQVPWIEAKYSVGELIDHLFDELRANPSSRSRGSGKPKGKVGLVGQLMNLAHQKSKPQPIANS